MTNHTVAIPVCQPAENAAAPRTLPLHGDRRLVTRYGAAALEDGYAAIPHVVVKYRRALQITAGEWDYICELWSYWRSAVLPAPSVETLARGLGVDQSTVRRYRAHLESKGLLRVVPDGPYNRYDLRPLIDAAVGLNRLQGNQDAPTMQAPGPRDSHSGDRAEMHAIKEVEKNLDFDSIPPYPLLSASPCAYSADSVSDDPTVDRLTIAVGLLSAEFGDDAPLSSLTRARTLQQDAGLSTDRFLHLLGEAATRTRARHDHIIRRRRDDHAPNGMPYLLAVLTDLLHPAPPRARAGTADGRQRPAARAHRQRRPGVERPIDYGAWNGATTDPDSNHDCGGPVASAPDANPTWNRVLAELSTDMLRENYARWFGPTRVIGDDGALLRISVPDDFHRQWLDRRLRPIVERALARVAVGVRVEFVATAA